MHLEIFMPGKRFATEITGAVIGAAASFVLLVVSLCCPQTAYPQGGEGRMAVKAAVLEDFQPQYSLDPNGRPTGFAIEVFERLAEMANLDVTYVVKQSWDAVQHALKTGEADVVPNMGVTERRRAFADFTAPVETFPVSIFVRESENAIRGRQDLAWRKVAVLEVNVGYSLLKGDESVQLVLAEHRSDALMLLLSGQVDALVYPEPVIRLDARRARIQGLIKPVGEPLRIISRGVAVAKGDAALFGRLDQAVNQFVLTGEYRRIYARWYGEAEPFWTAALAAKTAAGAAAVILALMLALHLRSLRMHRKELELRVKERTAQYQDLNRTFITLLENTTDYIFFKDKDFRFSAVSQTMAENTGHGHWRDMIGKNEQEVFPPEIAKHYHESEQMIIRTGAPLLNKRETYFTQEGERRYVLTNKWPIKDEDGKVAGLFGIARDVTDLVLAEEALKKSEARLRDIIDNAPVGVFRTMTGGGYENPNMEFARTLGYDDPEDLTRCVSDLIEIYENPVQREDFKRLMKAHGRVAGYEIKMRKKDGSDAWISAYARAVNDDSGEPLYYDGFTVDVTEKTLIHAALRESEERLQAIFRTAPVGFALLKNRVIIECNERMALKFGYEKEYLLGKPTRMLYANEEEWKRLGDEVYPVLETGEIMQVEAKTRHADGHEMDMLMSCSMIDAGSGDPTTIIVVQDITERKQAERELLALNQELEQYAYVVSHDLKAPLRAIHNYTDFLREELDGQALTAEVRQYLDGLGKAVVQGEDLVEDIMALSRIGNTPGPVAEVDLEELVDEVAKGLGFGPGDRIEIGGLPMVRADVTLLRQIIQNIVSNGIKFNTSNPKVIAVQWRDHGSGGEVTFTDNGIGIEEQYFEQVFRLFQRLHTDSEYEGTGVGLAIVKKAVERIGASLSLSSAPGQGSTFSIFLPESLISARPAPAAQRRTA